MEALAEDVRTNKSVDLVKQLKACILDSAKNIKSNDQTFSISTLPDVRDKMTELMGVYIDSIRRIEASHTAFMKLSVDLDIATEAEFDAFEEQYHANIEDGLNRLHPEDNALESLYAIIKHPEPQPRGDEEIVVEAQAQRQWPRDPITKTNIQEAVRNKICKHTYEKSSIEQYFNRHKANKKQTPCPVAGCTNKNVELKHLVPDEEAMALIESLNSESSSQ